MFSSSTLYDEERVMYSDRKAEQEPCLGEKPEETNDQGFAVFKNVTAPMFMLFLFAFAGISYTFSQFSVSSETAVIPFKMAYVSEGFRDVLLTGTHLLFDLNTPDGALENNNVYGDTFYSDVQAKLLKSAAEWTAKVGTPEVPDGQGLKPAWKTAGGVVPWITDDTSTPIEPTYHYSGAPNLVFFLVDDWGFNDVGYNSDYMSWTTPNIDKLARNGVKLTNYYTNELCTPSRASLMTGRYALRFGMQGSSLDKVELPTSEFTMAQELKSAGYRTNLVGKWHLGWSSNSKTPNWKGFDYFFGYLGGYIDYWTKQYGEDLDLHENTGLVTSSELLDSSVHSAYVYASKAEAVIRDHAKNYADKPMFLYYASQLIHTAWEAPQSFIDRCSMDADVDNTDALTYCGMNLLLDEVIGNLTCALEKYGMADNTIIVVASDNGGNPDLDGNCYPYRGAKGSLYRGAETVPALVYSPLIDKSRRGGTYDGQMHVTDWLPTFMGLATDNAWTGSYVGNEIDGVNQWSAIKDNTDSPRIEIVHFADSYGNVSIQYNMNKLVITGTNIDATTVPVGTITGTSSTASVCVSN